MNAEQFNQLLNTPCWLGQFNGAYIYDGFKAQYLDADVISIEERANAVITFADSAREHGMKEICYRFGKSNNEYFDALEALDLDEYEADNCNYKIYKSGNMYAAWWDESGMLDEIRLYNRKKQKSK